MDTVSDEELLKVIKDFLEMGHVENIVAMFHQDSRYLEWTGAILDDERFNVRLGVSILFEELKLRAPDHTEHAIPSLLPLLKSEQPNLRGEAISVLGIIGGKNAQHHIREMASDPHPQVRELVMEILEEFAENIQQS